MSRTCSPSAASLSVGKAFDTGSTGLAGTLPTASSRIARARATNGIWTRWSSWIGGSKHWLWRAINAAGDVLDILVQSRRNAKAAKRFLRKLTARFGDPRVVVTDKLRSYIKAIHDLAPGANHRAHKGLNNRAEASHRRKRPVLVL